MIGSSMGLALAAQGWAVTGWDPDAEALAAAVRLGAVAEPQAGPHTEGADLVVLAAPPRAVIEALPDLQTDTLVMDVAGVKVPVLEAAEHLPRFVGTHPMAGREHAGPIGATAGIFRGAAWILVEDGASEFDLALVGELVESMGARQVRMSASEHDAAVASISHVPQVVAASLMDSVADSEEAMSLAAGSFRDLTRVSLSPPGVWSEVLSHNRGPVADRLRDLADRLIEWSHLLDREEEISQRLAGARSSRRRLAPPVVGVNVSLEDRPGELVGIGQALARSKVDVRDLQLRHAPHGGGGVLTLSVRPGEAEVLREALKKEGFELLDHPESEARRTL